jgi:hypothetical protein
MRDFLLSLTVDFPDDLELGAWSPALLDDLMRTLRAAGFRRVNWLDYGSAVDPDHPLYEPILVQRPFGPASLRAIGEPLPAAVAAAHRHGLELIAVMKPYAGASIITRPDGGPDAAGGGRLHRIGGYLDDGYRWLQDQPDLRIARQPATRNPPDRPIRPADITALRLTKADDAPTRIDRDHLQLWTSPANWQYRLRDLPFELHEDVAPAPDEVRDYFGRLITARGAPVRRLTITGPGGAPLALDEPFVAITTTFRTGTPDFVTTPRSMIAALDAAGRELPSVVATRSATAYATRDFRTGGLEYDCGYGPFSTALDADNQARTENWDTPQGGCVAIAPGVNDELSGAPCESLADVQANWLRWVDWLLAAGVDGIDVRISAHGTHTDEPHQYGFNDEILAAVEDAADATTVAGYRGDRYTDFLRAASRRTRAAGRHFLAHLHTEAFRPNPVHGALMGIPPTIDFQWQRWLDDGLLDGATLRTSWYESLGPQERDDLPALLASPVVAGTIDHARARGVPLSLNRYAMDGGVRREGGRLEQYLDDLEYAYRHPALAGFDVYENWAVQQPSTDGSRLEAIGDFLPRIAERARRLGIN